MSKTSKKEDSRSSSGSCRKISRGSQTPKSKGLKSSTCKSHLVKEENDTKSQISPTPNSAKPISMVDFYYDSGKDIIIIPYYGIGCMYKYPIHTF